MRKIERNEQAFSFNPLTDDVSVIATLLKVGEKLSFLIIIAKRLSRCT